MKTKIAETPGLNQQTHLPFSVGSLGGKPVEVSYTGQDISTEGGLLLLEKVDAALGLTRRLAACLRDKRDPRYLQHSTLELVCQRVYQIAMGYEDGNDCDFLRGDPLLKLSVGRLPETGADLASQPTMCRLENSVGTMELYQMALVLADQFIESFEKIPPLIILDLDDTDHTLHGEQQLKLFNHYYGEHCYLPLHIYEGLSGKLVTTLLKPGRRSKNTDVCALLVRLIAHLRKHWPDTRIIVRGDSHFCSSAFMEWSHQEEKVNFITGLATNSKLRARVASALDSALCAYKANQKEQKRFVAFSYQAGSWAQAQRVIAKVEVGARGTNIRFVVTDMKQYRPGQLYNRVFCARANMELRIKDHKLYLKSDRSSCHSFKANQFRLFLHSAAYVLIHALQSQVLAHTQFATATFKTLQLKLLKTAAWVVEKKTKVKVVVPKAFPFLEEQWRAFQILARAG